MPDERMDMEAAGFPEPDDPGPWTHILAPPGDHVACQARIAHLEAQLADRDARIAMLTKGDT